MKPYRQGEIDGTCGVFATINSIRWFNGEFTEEIDNNILELIVNSFDDYSEVVLNGIGHIPVKRLYNIIKKSKLNYLVKDLVIEKPKLSSDVREAFDQIESEFSKNNMLVYLGITDYQMGGHWSLLKQVDSKNIYFFDSVGMKSRKIKNLEFTNNANPPQKKKKTLICPKEILYIKKK